MTKNWRKWFEKNKRPDELVIPEDVHSWLGDKRFRNDIGGKINKDGSIAEITYRKIKGVIDENLKLLRNKLGNELIDFPYPNIHQFYSDIIIATTIIKLVKENQKKNGGNDKNRKIAQQNSLVELVLNSDGSSRTNYQFVRNFIRRNMAGILKTYKLKLDKYHDLYPRHIINCLHKESNKKTIKKVVGKFITPKSIYDLLTIISFFRKGEFTHFNELYPVLEDLNGKKGFDARIGVVVSNKERYDYIKGKLNEKANIQCKNVPSKIIRYYVFPNEYLIMISGEPKQFMVFWGKTSNEIAPISCLVECDWMPLGQESSVAFVD